MERDEAAAGAAPDGPWAAPRTVTDPADCDFYHVRDLPGLGRVGGAWDLRPNVDSYLSATDFRGRRVLEIGTADGYLATELERRGAEVVAFDLGEEHEYDAVPAERPDVSAARARMRELQRRRRNAFWLAHRLLRSAVRMVYGHVGALPRAIGPVDYCFFGNLLQHLENPLRALAGAATLARRGIIVTEANWHPDLDPDQPVARLLAPEKLAEGAPEWCHCWWQLTPGCVGQWLSILGFESVERSQHRQRFVATGLDIPHFTIVARRRL